MNGIDQPQKVGIRGSEAPLSWNKTYSLQDEDGDGIYEATISFSESQKSQLEYKFIYGDDQWELEGLNNRVLKLEKSNHDSISATFNQPDFFTKAELDQMIIPAEGLQQDIDIVQKAYTTLHPGLYRYNTEEEINAHFDALRKELSRDQTLTEVFLAFARFVPKIRCGHTLINPYNQSETIKKAFFNRPDKLPFTFEWVDDRMILTHNLSEVENLEPGVEILTLNGHTIGDIQKALLPYVSADGYRLNKRKYALQLGGVEMYDYFDTFFPLLFPPQNGGYEIEAFNHQTSSKIECSVATMSRAQRKSMLTKKYGLSADSYDDSWQFDLLSSDLGYLKLGTFTVWNFKMDWKDFLKNAFRELKEKNTPNLVIDIRGNEGGMGEVAWELSEYLLKKEVKVEQMKSLTRYQKVPENLQAYLSTWDDSIFDISSRVEPADDGFFRQKGKQRRYETYKKSNNKLLFDGKVFLLTDASNSSATFYLARMMKQSGLATLVGQTTGGTRKGINGGMMFFLRLPHSGIEMDIPLIGSFPYSEQPDQGVVPDGSGAGCR